MSTSGAVKSSSEQKRRSSVSGSYSYWGLIPIENCVTAVPENLIVNIAPTSSQAEKIKKSDEPSCSNSNSGESFPSKAFVGAAHLDTFSIHEVLTDLNQEFSTKPVQSIQLPSSLQNRCMIFRAKWVSILPTNINGSDLVYQKVLVLCTNLAAYFFNEIGTKQLLKFEYDNTQTGNVDPMDLTKCSRTVAATKENIILGNDRGHVLIFTCELKGKGASSGNGSLTVKLQKSMKICSEPIAELCAKKNGLLVVGISSGSLSVWTGFQEEGGVRQPIKSAEYVLSKPETVTGLVLWYPYAIASYGSGLIRLFNLIQRVLSAKVFAHSRWISSMDLCWGAGLLLTIAEDDEARIWSLRRRQKGEQRSPIKLHSSIRIEDVNFIGGKFLNNNGNCIGLANLGSKELAVYATSSTAIQHPKITSTASSPST